MRGQILNIPGLSFYRDQDPFTLGFVFTERSRGSAFVNLSLDPRLGKEYGVNQYNKWTLNNVQFGRATSLSGIQLRAPIALEVIPYAPYIDLQLELSRVQALK